MSGQRGSRVADVLVIGAGHNGLICAAYLARAGHDVLLVESRSTVGGLASTVSALDARFNICNCDHTMIRANPLNEELELEKHGLTYLEQEPSFLNVSWSGEPPWVGFHDVERNLSGLAETRPDQVDGYRRYLKVAAPVADLMVEMASVKPGMTRMTRTALGRRTAAAMRLLKWSRRSAIDVLSDFFTDETMITPALATGPTVWGARPDAPGTGLAAAGYAMRHRIHVGRPVGGSGALTDAVAASFTAAGGRIQCDTRVASLIVESGRVVGVEVDDGSELRADLVVTACDPRIVLGEWVTGEPKSARPVTARWRAEPVHDGYESKIDAVIDELPRYRILDPIAGQMEGLDPLQPTMIVAPTIEQLLEAHELIPAGRVAEYPTLLVNVPSVLDPSMMSSDGMHILSLEALFTPYALDGGWPDSGEPDRWLDLWGELVQPGFREHVVRMRTMTPDRYEAEFAMHRGHTPSYAAPPLVAWSGRRKEVTRYRAPLDGLVLTGAGTYPGAGVWGAAGRNAATVADELLQ